MSWARLTSGAAALGLALGVACGGKAAQAVPWSPAGCSPARVHYGGHPKVDGLLARLPWISGKPARAGLIGLIWYWPNEWRAQGIRTARIFAGGKAPAGYSTKILWMLVPRSGYGAGGARLTVRGTQLDGEGAFSQDFGAVSFAGQRGPAYASIVDVPAPGCWRLDLASGTTRARLTMLAVPSSG